MQVGIDIEKIDRFVDLARDHPFIKKFFSKEEIDYCFSKSNPAIHLAGVFSAKEAVIKTLDKPFVNLKKFVIGHDSIGKPFVKVVDDQISNILFDVSISHTDDIATAVVLRKDKK